MMYTAQLPRQGKAMSVRYPRGQGVLPKWRTPMEEIRIGTGRRLRTGRELAILSIGHVGNLAEIACQRLSKRGVEAGLYDMRFVKPLDEALLHEIFSIYPRVITVEDGCIQGGFGSAILEFMADHQYHADR